ncbi:hypothetical protein AB0K74_39670 [Streptomyces sp. NPDC056159]|uniref:hypothetical protein n=1 Tax=Streptomyces sp. NPDC056159 TaxID=3155537 RepID=UPI0034362D8A
MVRGQGPGEAFQGHSEYRHGRGGDALQADVQVGTARGAHDQAAVPQRSGRALNGEIVIVLEAEGIRPKRGEGWHPETVRWMLANPTDKPPTLYPRQRTV